MRLPAFHLIWANTLFIILLFGCKPNTKTVPQNPHIILIMADDLGVETLGVYGSQSYSTPNLDLLSNGGMRFTHCYSTPLCTPSRVQLMTGKYNFRNYMGFGLLDAKERTFGHLLKQEGYQTLVVGKWQLWGNAHQQKLAGGRTGSTPEQAGFDDYCLWQVKERGYRYKDPLLTLSKKGTVDFPGRYGPDIFVEHMASFMENNRDSPMFIYYPMVLTHDPFVPTPHDPAFDGFDSASKTNDTTYFGEMVGYMDLLVGKIVKKTEELGIRENTLILFIGDNGTDRDVTSRINDTLLTGNKGYTTGAGTHVPFIANWKGKIKAGSVNPNLIDFTDFLPTLLEVAGAIPKNDLTTDGLSFHPQLMGNKAETRDWIFCSYAPNWGKFKTRRYVQNHRWKLYGNGEFYDLEKDPSERLPLDLAKQPAQLSPIIKQFKSVLRKYESNQ
ncbi:MAG: sulfatase-like hydrolase/transferase [Bacteroidota bacterium]